MMHPEGWQVGMEVCVVITLNIRGEPRPYNAKITKIGRRWITLDDRNRFDAVTRRIDGGQYASPGNVYESEAAYRETTERQEMWRTFRVSLPYIVPDHMSAEDIANIWAVVHPPEIEEQGE